jgi:hypothetical protein
MIAWLLLPGALSGLVGVLAPGLARRLPPVVATWFLSAGAVLAAVASSISLGLISFVFIASSPGLDTEGHWSDHVLRAHALRAPVIGAVACAALVVLAARLVRAALLRVVAVRDAFQLSAALAVDDRELVVLDSGAREGMAVPGRPGRIIVTTGLLRSLDAEQRCALLTHERAHLTHRHYLHQIAAAVAAAVNPFLVGLPPALELSCERWADEEAAHVCPRGTVADTLRRAATGTGSVIPGVALAAGGADVATRVGAMLAPAPRLIAWRLALLTALLMATIVAVALAMNDTEDLFELAQHAYRAAGR